MTETSQGNSEWRLGDFLNVLAAEVERAQDTLSLKSLARGTSLGVQGLGLDLAVQVRVDERGQPFFRSSEPGEPCATVLKLQICANQSEEARERLDGEIGLPLAVLPEIAPQQIAALQDLSVFTVDDLARLCRTPVLVGEVSRSTGIPDPLLRRWLGLPYLSRIVPPVGSQGQTVAIEGGNLGGHTGDESIFFGQQAATLLAWEEARVLVEIPAGTGTEPVYAWIDGARSNVLSCSAGTPAVDLEVQALAFDPGTPTAADRILFEATLVNLGETPIDSFSVEWSIDGACVRLAEEPRLDPGRSRRIELRQALAAGPHQVLVVVDPEHRLPMADRTRASAERSLTVKRTPTRARR